MSIPQSGGGVIESYHDLVDYLESGCKPKADWRIGTEHEKFGFISKSHAPLPYEGECSILTVLEGLRDRFGWAEVREGDYLIGLEKDGANVSLEPGGQLELSGAPLETIHQTCDEVNQHLAQVRDIAEDIGASFIGLGAAPEWRHEDMPVLPKGRYKLMTRYMDSVGTKGKEMMYRSCTVQVNLDFSSESDMVKKLRTGVALQPIATALFANSPFFEGKPSGYQSYRARIWQDVDKARTGMVPFVFEEGMGFERWVEYALDVPMYFVYRNGVYIDALGMSFRDFIEGKLPALPGEKPTLSDWADHLTTVFPEARIKKFMEMRGADGGPWRRLCALPAFWVGLLYDGGALDAAWDIAKKWDEEQREKLRLDVAKDGVRAKIGKHTVLDIAREVLSISHEGLRLRKKQGAGGMIQDETHFLNALMETAESGQTPSDELLENYNGKWKQNLSHLYEDYAY